MHGKFIKSRKGQIGPMALEDIPSLTIMLMMTMIFIVLIFKIVGGYLETNRAVDMYDSAVELSNVLKSKSELVYEGQYGVLDESKFGGFDLDNYKLAEYECSVEIKDLKNNEVLISKNIPDEINVISSISTVAIYRTRGDVNEGLLSVYMWRT